MGFTVTRRQLVGGAAAVALLGLTGLAGCGSGSVEGKTLYCATAWDSGTMQTITFDDADTCRYAGEQELAGTWSQEGDDIVVSLPGGYEAMTLKKLDGGEGYEQAGWEDFGERYLFSEDEAREYREEFLDGSAERVAGVLESTVWRLEDDGSARTADEAISFGDGEATFSKGVYDQSAKFNRVPDSGSWVARDHSGEYEVEVDGFTASRSGSSTVPLYTGTLTVGGEPVAFKLWLYDDGPSLMLEDAIRFSDEEAFE